MSISARNLWPADIAVTETVAPVAILKEQASLLGEQTQNLVEARVRQEPSRINYGGHEFVYSFELIAPALDRYTYELFRVSNGLGLYPLEIAFAGSGYPRKVSNEDEFMKELEIIFSSDKAKSIIKSLIAQSRA
jgi:hypothetical protein